MSAHLEERVNDRRRNHMGGVRGSARPIEQAFWPVGLIAVHPLVGRLPADAVAASELGDVTLVALVVGDELHPLIHERRLLPRHRAPRLEVWRNVSPMSLDCCVTYVPGPYLHSV